MDQMTELDENGNPKKPVKVNWDKLNPAIEFNGRAITLPALPQKMDLDAAIKALNRLKADEEQTYDLHEMFDAYPTDAAVALVKAMKELYGWASPVPTPGFFGPKPPQMLSVKTGWRDEDVIQVPLGSFRLPGVDAPISTAIVNNTFIVYGEIKKKHRHLILELATLARKILKEESIYRGKPIRLLVDDNGDLLTKMPPEFLNVEDISEADLIFDDQVRSQIETHLLTPIKETENCRRHKIPLKRGVLLEGKFGTGKSLTSRLTARVCELNGWTYVYLDRVKGLRNALEFAKKYAPAVVFAEDIDTIMGERDEEANDLINVIDGVVTKGQEVMTVLTTNDVNKIHPVILRPGRLDAVISLKPPGAAACERLIRHYAGKLLKADASLVEASKSVVGMIPASIRECVERAKLGMIARRDNKLDSSDIVVAAESMKNHMALLEPKAPEPTSAQQLAEGLKGVLINGSHDKITQIHEKVVEIHGNVV